jgi:hypothetical protein
MKHVTRVFVVWVLRKEKRLPLDLVRFIVDDHLPWVPKGMPRVRLESVDSGRRVDIYIGEFDMYTLLVVNREQPYQHIWAMWSEPHPNWVYCPHSLQFMRTIDRG